MIQGSRDIRSVAEYIFDSVWQARFLGEYTIGSDNVTILNVTFQVLRSSASIWRCSMELMLGRDWDALMNCNIKSRHRRLAFKITMAKKRNIQRD